MDERDPRYGDFKPGDRVTYLTGKWQGTLVRRMKRNSHDDWLVAWDDRTNASAKTENLRRATEPPSMKVEVITRAGQSCDLGKHDGPCNPCCNFQEY